MALNAFRMRIQRYEYEARGHVTDVKITNTMRVTLKITTRTMRALALAFALRVWTREGARARRRTDPKRKFCRDS